MKVKVRTAFLVSVAGLIIISFSIVISISYFMGKDSVNNVLNNLIQSTSSAVINNTINYLKSADKGGFIGFELTNNKILQNISDYNPSINSLPYKKTLKDLNKIIKYYDNETLKKYSLTKKKLKALLFPKLLKRKQLVDYSFSLLSAYKHISMFHYGDKDEDFFMVKRMRDKSISMKYVLRFTPEQQLKVKGINDKIDKKKLKHIAVIVWNHTNIKFYSVIEETINFTNTIELSSEAYNPKQRPWYKGAEKQFKIANKTNNPVDIHWTDAYVFYSDQTPGITCSIVIPNKKNQIEGVYGVDLSLTEISTEYLANLIIGKSGKVFILTDKAEILAYAPENSKIKDPQEKEKVIKQELKSLVKQIAKRDDPNNPQRITGYKFKLTPIQESKVKLYKVAFQQANIKANKGQYKLKNTKRYTFDHNDTRYLFILSPFPKGSYWNWMVGIVVPEDDFMSVVKNNTFINLGVSIFILLISIIAIIIMASKVSKPLNDLVKETKKVRQFDLTNPIKIKTALSEIDQMSSSFYNMEIGLRSFEKYVPSELVRYLIQSGQEAKLEGESKSISIFFSDIANFTSISEKLNPQELVFSLSEYLDEMSTIISDNSGTIDKYIGDAIMAFWGAPKDCEEHAFLACKSAIENQKRLIGLQKKWESKNMPSYNARIGINTGKVIVGNMGSKARFNYTVIGDTVNLASRLEGLNKYYNTNIICGEATQQLVKDKIKLRKLDMVTVKGKTEPSSIYEVVDTKKGISIIESNFIYKFERGLDKYFNRDFKEAINIFANCLKIKPYDEPSKIFLERSMYYMATPPEKSWDGVSVFTKK